MEAKVIKFEDFSKICRLCLKTADVLEPLQNHLEFLNVLNIKDLIIFDLPENVCNVCIKFLQEVSQFVKNFQINETILNNLLKLKKEQENNHEISNERGKFSCNICQRSFSKHTGLKRHLKTHADIKPFKCDVCDKSFAKKCIMERHKFIHSGQKPFECTLCSKTSRRKDQILYHIQTQHPNTENIDIVLKEHEVTEEFVPQLEQVVTEKLPRKRLEICLCNLCGKVFKRRGYLKNHMAIHAEIKPFQCKLCGKGFTQRHVLTRHNLVHTMERPFQCNLCGKTFTRKEVLTEHLQNHEGVKSHLCSHCGKYFASKFYLNKHLKYYSSVRMKTKTNKCICPECGKLLHSESYLKTHLLTHGGEKPFKCEICLQRFTVRYALVNHMNIHKGVKPFKCEMCDKCFRTKNSLKKHQVWHTGERPFKCTSCNKGFVRRSHLKRHFKTH